MATNMLKMLGPSMATIAITRTKNGNAKKRSTMRMMTVSTQPPAYPDVSPMTVPTTAVTDVAPNAIRRSIRPP